MNKKIFFRFVSLVIICSYFYMHAGLGTQFNIDKEVREQAAEQKTQEDTFLKQSSPTSSPKSILRKKSQYVSPQEEWWVFGLLKCLQT